MSVCAGRKEQEEINLKESTKKSILEYIKAFAIAIVVVIFCNNVVIINASVPSSSMEDTIEPGDRLIGFRLSYLFDEPERGDVIIFKYPDDETRTFIKRVIGLPGETVEIRDGKVYVDDAEVPLEEEYIKDAPEGDYGPYEVPEDSYFVMGDNRNHSLDSRFWENHFVNEDKILAKAVFEYYPELEGIEEGNYE